LQRRWKYDKIFSFKEVACSDFSCAGPSTCWPW
jgi:hypothetical protein